MKYLIALMLTAASMASYADEIDLVESIKIDYLISAIETLDVAQFVRNGKPHAARVRTFALKAEEGGVAG